jgi:hypothetical protein
MLALDGVSCSGEFTLDNRCVVGCVIPTAGLDHLKEITYLFYLNEIILESKFFTPKRLLAYRLWNAYQWLYWTNVIQAQSTRLTIIILKSVLCGCVNKTSGNNLQRHIKENNKCTLVVELDFVFVLLATPVYCLFVSKLLQKESN